MALNLGGVIRLTYAVKNDLGALVNPTSATLSITQPDGVVVTPTVTLPPTVTGQLVVDYAPTQAGLHSAQWLTTAPITSEPDMFVAERPAALLVSVDESVAHLRAGGIITTDADREQLQWLCIVATSLVEGDLTRVIVRRTFTETHDGNWDRIILFNKPVVSITSVTENGTLLTGSDYFLNARTGTLYRGTTLSLRNFVSGTQNVVVVGVAGYADPPKAARQGALNLVQNMWQQTQQAAHPLVDETSLEAFTIAALPGLSQIPGYNSLRAAPGSA